MWAIAHPVGHQNKLTLHANRNHGTCARPHASIQNLTGNHRLTMLRWQGMKDRPRGSKRHLMKQPSAEVTQTCASSPVTRSPGTTVDQTNPTNQASQTRKKATIRANTIRLNHRQGTEPAHR